MHKVPIEDGENQTFWENILCMESRLQMCSPECAERCNGDNEENEANDDWYPIRMHYDDEIPVACTPLGPPIASFPHACPEPQKKPMDLRQFSLPWADLDGKRKDCILADKACARTNGAMYGQQRNGQSSDPAKSLLGFSGSTSGTALSGLPRPRFVTGIPTKAYQYKPDPSDPIDVALKEALKALNEEAAMVLALLRVKPGRYEIDGRQVVIYEDTQLMRRRLLVHEDEVGAPSMADMPLDAYIRLVSNVALDLQKPVAAGLTFFEPASKFVTESDGPDRYRAMRIACTQAKIREDSDHLGGSAGTKPFKV